jgi:RNA polymerase sigma-70 factor (ECF subfamily)
MNVNAVALTAAPSKADAFRALFEAEGSYVLHALRRLGVAERDLDDVTHDVFIQVYRRLDDYDPARPVRPWLFGFAFRLASDYRRLARNRYERVDDAIERRDERPNAEHHVAAAQDRALVHAALEKLDLDKRAVFILHEIDEQPIPEVAAALGIPLNTAYSRLRAAREEFAVAVRRARRPEESHATR